MSLNRRIEKLEGASRAADPPWVPPWIDDDVGPWKTIEADGRIRELNAAEIEAARAEVARGEAIIIREYLDE